MLRVIRAAANEIESMILIWCSKMVFPGVPGVTFTAERQSPAISNVKAKRVIDDCNVLTADSVITWAARWITNSVCIKMHPAIRCMDSDDTNET